MRLGRFTSGLLVSLVLVSCGGKLLVGGGADGGEHGSSHESMETSDEVGETRDATTLESPAARTGVAAPGNPASGGLSFTGTVDEGATVIMLQAQLPSANALSGTLDTGAGSFELSRQQ